MKTIEKCCDIWNKFQKILSASQKRWGIVVFFLSLFGAIVETLGVSAILPLVQVMMNPEQLYEISIVKKFSDSLRIASSQQLLVCVASVVIGIYVFKNIYLCFLSWIRVKYSSKIQRELAVQTLRSYSKRGYSFFRSNNSSTLMRGVLGSVSGVNNVVYLFMKILAEILTIMCIFAFIIYTDWKMALSMMVMLGGCLIVILYAFKEIMKRAGAMYYDNMALASKWLLQLFSGIKEVLVLNRGKYFWEKFENSYMKQQKGQIRQTVASEAPSYIIEGTCVAGIIVAVCIRVSNMEDTAAYIPQLASFAVAAFRLLPSVGRITSNFNNCVFSMPAVDEVYKNIVEVEEFESKNKNVVIKKQEKIIAFKDKLEIKNVVWRYPDGVENVLDNVSLTIYKGDSIALVGASGAGKSTLADIILGLFQPQEGSIIIDGKNISDNILLSEIISFVPQAVYLIDDTIRRNIAFGIYDDDIDEKAIWSALEQAQMKEFVEALPEGLDTIVGERGVRFSGGQSQRLAIARALYTKPDILVLDEATSALDSETETAVMEAIDALQGKVTLIVIAHRLTTIKNCSKIYEISNGMAIPRSYKELI